MPQISRVKNQTQISTSATTIAATGMLTVSTVSLLLTWGILAAAVLSPGVHQETDGSAIVCQHMEFAGLRGQDFVKIDAGEKANARRLKKQVQEKMQLVKKNIEGSGRNYQSVNEKNEFAKNIQDFSKEFVSMMRKNPQDALALLPSEQELNDLNLLTKNCFPEPLKALEGAVEVFHADDFKNQRSKTDYYLKAADRKKYILHLPRIEENIESRTKLSIQKAYQLNNEVLVDEYMITGQPGNPPVLGPQSVMAILVNTTVVDKVLGTTNEYDTPMLTKAEAANLLYGDVNNFYQINSYQKMSVVGAENNPGNVADVFGPYHITVTVNSYYCSKDQSLSCSGSCPDGKGSCQAYIDFGAMYTSIIRAADADIDFRKYGGVLSFVSMPSLDIWQGISSAGKISTISNDFGTDEVNQSIAAVLLGDYLEGNEITTAHELGHSFGSVNHAGYLNCDNSFDFNVDCRSEYGDLYDVMGLGDFFHFNAKMKESFGWLAADHENHKIITVTKDTSEPIYLDPIEKQDGKIQGVRFRRGPDDGYKDLYIEYRQPDVLDEKIFGKALEFGAQTDVFSGALLHLSYIGSSVLLDVQPPAKVYKDLFLSTIHAATESGKYSYYTDPYSGTKIGVGKPDPVRGLPVMIDIGRTDFTPPVIDSFEFLSYNEEDCSGNFKITASDAETGISKIEALDQTFFSDEAIVRVPSTLFNSSIAVTVFDNVESQGGVGNNVTKMNFNTPFNNCDIKPIITVSSPLFTNDYVFEPNYDTANEVVIKEVITNPAIINFNITDDSLSSVYISEFFKDDLYNYASRDPLRSFKNFSYTLRRMLTPGRHEIVIDGVNSGHSYFAIIIFDVVQSPRFVRGDVNQDGRIDVSDSVTILENLYQGTAPINCLDSADVNNDEELNLTDGVALLQNLFMSEKPADVNLSKTCEIDLAIFDLNTESLDTEKIDCGSFTAGNCN
ncbi:MAG: hypothetical protein PHI63_03465 [Patescibacteria group bacterium]|nr:hypothetical protein [Patescibacteria group bacterium]